MELSCRARLHCPAAEQIVQHDLRGGECEIIAWIVQANGGTRQRFMRYWGGLVDLPRATGNRQPRLRAPLPRRDSPDLLTECTRTTADVGRRSWGWAISAAGPAAARWLAQQEAVVTVTDTADAAALADVLPALSNVPIATLHFGGHRDEDFRGADLVVVNPAVRPASPWLDVARRCGARLCTELELFIENCPARIIGVTGSNGKSTTAAVIASILKNCRPPSVSRRQHRRQPVGTTPGDRGGRLGSAGDQQLSVVARLAGRGDAARRRGDRLHAQPPRLARKSRRLCGRRSSEFSSAKRRPISPC